MSTAEPRRTAPLPETQPATTCSSRPRLRAAWSASPRGARPRRGVRVALGRSRQAAQLGKGSKACHLGVDYRRSHPISGAKGDKGDDDRRLDQRPWHGPSDRPAFLTRLPLRRAPCRRRAPMSPARAGRCRSSAPWSAAWRAASIGSRSGFDLPPFRRAPLAVAATLVVTGCLHEDGLADTVDGFGGGATRERKLEIMRDSRHRHLRGLRAGPLAPAARRRAREPRRSRRGRARR